MTLCCPPVTAARPFQVSMSLPATSWSRIRAASVSASHVRKTYYDPHYNGFEPRFGVAYRASEKTVIRSGFAMFDDHNNTLVQEAQDPRISWPEGIGISVGSLNRAAPTIYFNNLPAYSSFFNPFQPFVAFGADNRNKIPYAMEYNFGVEQQLAQTLVLNLDYVGSLGRHLFIQPAANTALTPGPGPVGPREPYPRMVALSPSMRT